MPLEKLLPLIAHVQTKCLEILAVCTQWHTWVENHMYDDLYMQYLLSYCNQNSFFKSYLNIYLPFSIYLFM